MCIRRDENCFLKKDVRTCVMTDYIAVTDSEKKKLHTHKDMPAISATFHVYLLTNREKSALLKLML